MRELQALILELLRTAVRDQELTHEQLSQRSGLHPLTIGRALRGERFVPDTIGTLAHTLRVDLVRGIHDRFRSRSGDAVPPQPKIIGRPKNATHPPTPPKPPNNPNNAPANHYLIPETMRTTHPPPIAKLDQLDSRRTGSQPTAMMRGTTHTYIHLEADAPPTLHKVTRTAPALAWPYDTALQINCEEPEDES